MAAGDWYLTTDCISGLEHIEGELASIIADGGDHEKKTVTNGEVKLNAQTSKVHIGLGFTGFIKSMNLGVGEGGAVGQTLDQNINRVGIRFLNTLGARYGTDLYRMQDIVFRSSADPMNRPPPLFTGDKEVSFSDVTTNEKHILIQQTKPLPCVVQLLVPYIETAET